MFKKDQQLSTTILKQSAADITPSGLLMPQMARMVFVTVVVVKRTIREFWNVARAMCFNHLELASFKDSPVNCVLICKYLVFVSLYLKFMKKRFVYSAAEKRPIEQKNDYNGVNFSTF